MTDDSLSPEEKISSIVRNGVSKLEELFVADEGDLFAIDICRAVDFQALTTKAFEGTASEDEYSIHFDFTKRGFPILLSFFYKKCSFRRGFAARASIPELDHVVDRVLVLAGKLSIAEQFVKQSEAQLLQLSEQTDNVFRLNYPNENSGIELFENTNIAAYFKKVSKTLSDRYKQLIRKRSEISQQMKNLVFPDKDFLLKYDTNPDIDRYYSKLGNCRLATSQLYDVFDEQAIFGGIEYWKYILVLKELIGIAYKHTDYCSLLVEKSPQSNLRNTICIPRILDDIIPGYAEYLKLKQWEVKQIFECFTADPDNIEHHLRDQKSFSPIFVKISETHVMQSVFGSLNNPLLFLLRELIRRYKRDYDNNTDREGEFRDQFYEAILEKAAFRKKLITVRRQIAINVPGVRTDIDAVIFDRKTGNLALIQLKWQMLFAHDLKERRNRLSEFRKAEEWVRKMKAWSTGRSSKDVLSALTILEKLPDKSTQINKIFLFVVNRYNARFTGYIPSEDAAWASWYLIDNILESLESKLKDPISDLYRILTSPSLTDRNMHNDIENFEMEVEGIKFVYTKSDNV